MRRGLIIYRYAALPVCFALIQNCVLAQDLGSSSGLFNSPNPKTRTTPKKVGSKSKESKPVSKKIAVKSKGGVRNAAIAGRINKSKSALAGKNTQIAPAQKSPTDDSDSLFEQAIKEGNAARDRREYEKAEAAYLRAQTIKKDDFRAVCELGNLYSDQQRWEEAENYLMKALKLISPNERKRLAGEFEAVGDGFLRAGRNADAARVYRQAAALDKGRTSLAGKLAKTRMN